MLITTSVLWTLLVFAVDPTEAAFVNRELIQDLLRWTTNAGKRLPTKALARPIDEIH